MLAVTSRHLKCQINRVLWSVSRQPLRTPLSAWHFSSAAKTSFPGDVPPAFGRSAPKSSVDADEVSHFDALASSWWDPHGPSRLLHLMNPLRHDFISRCLASTIDALPTQHSVRYLDVGCGGGIFAESAARLSHTQSITAVDPSKEVLRIAEAHARRDPQLTTEGRLQYINAAVEHLPMTNELGAPSQGYDVVTLFEVLEHVSSPSDFLATLTKHVRPGGWFIGSTIARTWTSWATTKVMAEDVLGIVPRGTHDWAKYINEDELRAWFTKQGSWESPRAMGVIYVPGFGWREVRGSERLGNYFFGIRKSP